MDSPLVRPPAWDGVLGGLPRLTYTPNAVARSLKTHRTHSLGIIGPAATKVANIEKLNSYQSAAKASGCSILLGFSDGSSRQDQSCIEELRTRGVDGLILMGRGFPDSIPVYQRLLDAGMPFVTNYPIAGLEIDCVCIDTRRAFAKLTDHVIRLGHTRIGLVLDPYRSQYTINRLLGFRDAMTAARLPVRKEWIVHATPDGTQSIWSKLAWEELHFSDYQYGFWAASHLLARRERPTAIVCFSDEFAIGVMRAAALAGICVPDELAAGRLRRLRAGAVCPGPADNDASAG